MRRIVLIMAVATMLIAAAPAGAKTSRAWLGEPAAAPAGTPKGATLNQFFPRKITIRAGDRIVYSTHAFHTASYLGGASPPPGALPDPTGAKYSGINDAAGAPFWFDGLTRFINNVAVFAPTGSPRVTRGGEHSTGVVTPAPGATTASAALAFPKPGTYQIVCLLHPGMKQTVVVKAKRVKKVDTASAVATRIARESRVAWARANDAARTPVPANTVLAGVDSGQTTLFAFLPATLTVSPGTTVSFVNMAPTEIHNEAWGPQDWILAFTAATDLLPLGGATSNQVTPVNIYGSDPPPARVYTGSNHGNGFLATNLTDDQPGDPPNGLPQTNMVTFTTPGTYHYFCLIHGPDMSGDIIVK